MAPSGFSTDLKELVRSRTDLVDLISEQVSLTPLRGGRDYVGLCPFHDDHNPSFHVYPDRQSYKCWSCGAGGDCFSFVMECLRIEFREALEHLARRANVEIPRFHRRGDGRSRDEKQRLYEAIAWAEREYHRFLLSASEAARARDYLNERGFADETIRKFQIGYSPDAWDWLIQRAGGKFSPKQLFAVGLAKERRDGRGLNDYFRDRVMFPIRDVQGRPVAFGARILPDDTRDNVGKYVNSRDSEFFSKSRLLYGFDIARDAIRRSETVVVVEGYTDCILPHQHGLTNFVAVCGTALTDAHASLLKRFARRVVLVFDGDRAGQGAAERSMETLLAQELDLRLLTLPEGRDPAEFVAERGADAFRERIESAPEAWEFKLQSSINRFGLDSVDSRHRVLDDMLELVARIRRLAGTPREQLVFSRLGQRLSVDEPFIRRRLQEFRQKAKRRGASSRPDSSSESQPAAPTNPYRSSDLRTRLECELLEIVLTAPEWARAVREALGADSLRNESCRSLLQVCYDLEKSGTPPALDRVMATLEEPELKRLLVTIDEHSRRKQLARKLRHDPRAGPSGSRPKLLELTLERLAAQIEKEARLAVRGQLAAQPVAGALNDDARDMLRRMTRFHQKRTT